MDTFSTRARACTAKVAVCALALAAPASAQTQADADLKAISGYALTMPKYKQYLDASMNLGKAAQADPQVAKQLDGFGNKSVAEQVKALEAVPQVRGAITSSGLSTRDYLLTGGALLQAGMAYSMTKQMGMPPDSVIKSAGVSRANLEFYQKNEAEIVRLSKEYEAKMPKEAEESGEKE